MPNLSVIPESPRLAQIARARQALLVDQAGGAASAGLQPWIERSWQRCLLAGKRPQDRVAFDAVSTSAMRHATDGSQALLQAARPVLTHMAQAMAATRYFAIVTDARGIVVQTAGPVDRRDVRATAIARVGVDLSEAAVGTTAIGATLSEQQGVWLHRGEHFFADTSMYSCAGAPLFGPQGQCLGMLDLTGIDVPERPELQHLVLQSAQTIENSLLLAEPHALLIRLNWPGRALQMADDGLITLNADGHVVGSNRVARQLVPQALARVPNAGARNNPLHASDLFALPWTHLFDTARHGNSAPLEVPLWSGLRVLALPSLPECVVDAAGTAHGTAPGAAPVDRTLRVAQSDLIRQTMAQTRGNVAEAARILGISRATIYRKLGQAPR